MLEQDYQLLIGTYSELNVLAHQPWAPAPGVGIYSLGLSRAGRLSALQQTPTLNPAVLIPAADQRHLYALLETIREEGTVERFEIEPDGKLISRDRWQASGRSTCFLALSPDADAAVVVSYWDAMIDVCDVDSSGRLGAKRQTFRQHHRAEGEWRQVRNREDHWGNRQVGPHAHCAHFWHEWVFIPDLGENAVFQYRYDRTRKQLVPETHIDFEPGSGPRHMAMHPSLDICYISNELFNTVCVARLDRAEPAMIKQRLLPFQYESTVENRDQESYVSEIRLSPDARFLYVSNRGDDSIAVFKVYESGGIARVGIVPTEGRFPRHFAITPCGKGLLACNQDSGTVVFFERDRETGTLAPTGEHYSLPAPCYARFINT